MNFEQVTEYSFTIYLILTIILLCTLCIIKIVQQKIYDVMPNITLWCVIIIGLLCFILVPEELNSTIIFILSLVGITIDILFFKNII